MLPTIRQNGQAVAAVAWITWIAIGCAAQTPTPPRAKQVPTAVNLGGETVVDPYWWLRNKSDPAVIDYLKAENAYTDAAMRPTQPLQERLYREMLARIRETDESVPYREGDWWYSRRTEQGKQYPIYLRRKGAPTAPPQVLADVNQLAAGHPFFDYVPGTVSDNGNLLAYSTDVTPQAGAIACGSRSALPPSPGTPGEGGGEGDFEYQVLG